MQFKASTVPHLPCWSWQLTTFAVHVSTPDPDRLSNSNRIRFHGHCNYPSLPTSARSKSRILQCESSYHFFTGIWYCTVYFTAVQKKCVLGWYRGLNLSHIFDHRSICLAISPNIADATRTLLLSFRTQSRQWISSRARCSRNRRRTKNKAAVQSRSLTESRAVSSP